MQRTWILALAAAAALAACGDDPTGTNGDAMTRAEAAAVAGSMAEVGAVAASEGMTGVTETAQGSGTFTLTQNTSHPCPRGGNVGVSLSVDVDYDQAAQSFELDASGTLTHNACAFENEGATFTFNGDPGLQIALHAVAANGVATAPWTSSIDGAFAWSSSDGRAGRCVVDLLASTDFADRERTITGEVCGHTIQQTVAW